jgi:hypothetical protein
MLANLVGRVEKGVKDIDSVSTIITEVDDNAMCVICHDTFKEIKDNGIDIRKTVCKHIFCDVCISRWLSKNKKCPCCFTELDKDTEDAEQIVHEMVDDIISRVIYENDDMETEDSDFLD